MIPALDGAYAIHLCELTNPGGLSSWPRQGSSHATREMRTRGGAAGTAAVELQLRLSNIRRLALFLPESRPTL